MRRSVGRYVVNAEISYTMPRWVIHIFISPYCLTSRWIFTAVNCHANELDLFALELFKRIYSHLKLIMLLQWLFQRTFDSSTSAAMETVEQEIERWRERGLQVHQWQSKRVNSFVSGDLTRTSESRYNSALQQLYKIPRLNFYRTHQAIRPILDTKTPVELRNAKRYVSQPLTL